MSCQQVSGFITTTPSITNTNTTVITNTPTPAATTNVTTGTIAAATEAEVILVSTIPATAIAASTALSTTAGSIASLTAATAEDQDPYVFTESVHTTPPVHFNAQKSRIRYVDSTATPPTAASTTTTTALDKETIVVAPTTTTITPALSTITNAKNCNNISNFKFTITSTLESTSTTTTTTTSAIAAITNCNAVSPVTTTCTSTTNSTSSTFKYGKQQQQQQQHQLQQQRKRQTINKSPMLPTSPPISPPLAGCVLQQHQLQNETKILSPTCNLQLTPSLWQTQLLLDTNINNIPPTSNNHNNNNSKNNTNTSTNLTLATATTKTTQLAERNCGNVNINSPMHSPTAVTATLLANMTTHCATTLPPSNFHHTTLAQHLHKVECIKKPPKRQTTMCIATQKMVMTPPSTPPTPPTMSPILLPPLQPLQTVIEQIPKPILTTISNTTTTTTKTPTPIARTVTTTTTTTAIDTKFIKEEIVNDTVEEKHHTDTDLNDIPVNVIFRKPQSAVTTPTTTTIKQEFPTIKVEPTEQPKLIQIISSPQQQQPQQQQQQQQPQQTLAKPTLIMPCTKVDIEAAVSTLQSMQQIALKEEMSSNAQQQQQQHQQQQQQNFINLQNQVVINNKNSNKTPAIKEKIIVQQNDYTCNKKLRSKPIQSTSSSLITNNLSVDHGTAVAIIKMSLSEMSAEITQLSNVTVLPYCLQQHWLKAESTQNREMCREERISQHKNLLRRQALQLLNTQGLQKLPLNVARKRLICVDRLLRKYDDGKLHTEHLNHSNKLCHAAGCQNRPLEMASHCWQHITQNNTQKIFQACNALDAAHNSICAVPVFDILHDVPLCELHEKQRDFYEQKLKNSNNNINNNNNIKNINIINNNNNIQIIEQQQKVVNDLLQSQQLIQQMPQLQKIHTNVINNNANNMKTKTQNRKRKVQVVNEVSRAQKRGKKCMTTTTTIIPTVATPTQISRMNMNDNATNLTKAMVANTSIMLSSVASAPSPPPPLLQRKSSTTSLESIGSASYNSASPPQHCYSYYSELQQQQQQHQQQQKQQQKQQHHPAITTQMGYVNAVPALAPLSFGFSGPFVNSSSSNNNNKNNNNTNNTHNNRHNINGNNLGNNSNNNSNNHNSNSNNNHNHGTSVMFNGNLGATISAADLKEHEINQIVSQFTMLHNNQGHNNNNNNNSSINANNAHHIVFNSYNNSSNSNLNFLNTNSDSNFTSALSTDELLTQDMMSICENSSAYASSEDTGLGGLSETELIVTHDAEDIPLGDTRLLEEHDLANVLSALPDDAFNELFTTVRQDERDEVERALELADKHLKSLQQTIGSGTSESDFLGDFLDVNDEILADTDDICGKMDIVSSVMHSPETSGIETSAMFIENSSGGMSTHSTASGTSSSSSLSSSSTSSSMTNSACPTTTLADMRGLVRT